MIIHKKHHIYKGLRFQTINWLHKLNFCHILNVIYILRRLQCLGKRPLAMLKYPFFLQKNEAMRQKDMTCKQILFFQHYFFFESCSLHWLAFWKANRKKMNLTKNWPFMTTPYTFNDLLYSSLQAFVLSSWKMKYEIT